MSEPTLTEVFLAAMERDPEEVHRLTVELLNESFAEGRRMLTESLAYTKEHETPERTIVVGDSVYVYRNPNGGKPW